MIVVTGRGRALLTLSLFDPKTGLNLLRRP